MKKNKINSKNIVKTIRMIKDTKHADQIIKNNNADLVSIGIKFINLPNWLISNQ